MYYYSYIQSCIPLLDNKGALQIQKLTSVVDQAPML